MRTKLVKQIAIYRKSQWYCNLETQLHFFQSLNTEKAISNWYKLFGSTVHIHQRKLHAADRRRSVRYLKTRLIGKSYKDFDALHEDVRATLQPSCWKKGYLAYYDAALRVGASMGFSPKKTLYLHRGALEGFLKLNLHINLQKDCFHLPMNTLPKALQRLGSVHTENFLCWIHAKEM